MRFRWLIALLILLGGWGALEFVLWQADLGEYASSPQIVELRQGSTALVAGGTAGIVYEGHRMRREAILLIRCKDEEQRFRMRPNHVTDITCGVRAQLLDMQRAERVTVLVRWGDDLDAGPADDVPTDAPTAIPSSSTSETTP